jgi:hypothetical protein
MRIPVVLRTPVLLLFLAIPAFLQAQSFQPIDPDELKMTSDPKAPGADAVYLEVRDITNSDQNYESFYARIKVLTEKGKELATIQLPYLKQAPGDTGNPQQMSRIDGIKGRTIHPDGTVIPLEVKPEDLLVAQSGQLQVNRKVLNMPSVEVGSVFEYMWTLRYPDHMVMSPTWDVQLPQFIHKAHFEFLPFKSLQAHSDTLQYITDQDGDILSDLIWWALLPPGAAVKSDAVNGLIHLDVTDIPAAPREEWMPPIASHLYKVGFYYTDNTDSGRWWIEASKRWDKRVKQFANPSKPIQAAVAQIVSPADADLVKAQKLYAAVQALDNTDFSRARSESELKQLHLRVQKSAEDTWAQKTGSSQDISLLFLAMLRAAGLTAYPALVTDRSQRNFDATYLSLDQLTDNLVILQIGDKEIVLDPGEKMCPFSQVAWQHTLAGGIRQDQKSFSFIVTPASAFKQNVTQRNGDLTLDGHGGISGRLDILMAGQSALHWRQLALENDDTELKKQFDQEFASEIPDGVEAHLDHFLALDNPDVTLIVRMNVTGTLGVSTSKRILLPGYFFQSRGRVPFVKEDKRETDVDMHYGDVVVDRIVYHLPEGTTIEGAPQSADIAWQGHAHYIAGSIIAPGQITITRSFARAFTLAKPEEYQDLRNLYQKVSASDQGQLVLATANPSAAPAAQGH